MAAAVSSIFQMFVLFVQSLDSFVIYETDSVTLSLFDAFIVSAVVIIIVQGVLNGTKEN